MPPPAVRGAGLEVNHSLALSGLISAKPPSPLLAERHGTLGGDELLTAGEPLSCVPPTSVLASLAACAKPTNWTMEKPEEEFRLSKGLAGVVPAAGQVPLVSEELCRTRYTPPSLPKNT